MQTIPILILLISCTFDNPFFVHSEVEGTLKHSCHQRWFVTWHAYLPFSRGPNHLWQTDAHVTARAENYSTHMILVCCVIHIENICMDNTGMFRLQEGSRTRVRATQFSDCICSTITAATNYTFPIIPSATRQRPQEMTGGPGTPLPCPLSICQLI